MRRTRTQIGRRGMTLLEVLIAITIIGILITFVVPSFNRVAEQSHVDGAAQYLRSIWSAQRVYWLENRTFTDSLSVLSDLKVLDSRIAGGSDGSFTYTITAAAADTFQATATRNGSSVWSGTLTIDQDGQVSGSVSKSGGAVVLLPPDF